MRGITEMQMKRNLADARTTRNRTLESLTEVEKKEINRLLKMKHSKKAICLVYGLSYSELKKFSFDGSDHVPYSKCSPPPKRVRK